MNLQTHPPTGAFGNTTLSLAITIIVVGLFIALVVTRLRRKQFLSFLFAVFFLFALGIIFWTVPLPYVSEALAHSLGDALVIAAILSITVDLYLKEQVLREVSSDVSKYLIGYRLPEEVQNRIRSLLQTRWVRRNFTIRVRLMEAHEKPGFVRLEISASRDLQNITSEQETYQDSMQWEKHSSEKVLEMRCDSNDSKAHYRLSGDALAREKQDEPGVMQAQGRRVRIPPVHEAINTYYRFTTRYEASFPENYSDMVSFDYPTIGVILEVECPPNFRITALPADVSTYNRWEYRRLFLPGETIRFRWERVAENAR